jgi:hypothetical protein
MDDYLRIFEATNQSMPDCKLILDEAFYKQAHLHAEDSVCARG